MPRGSGVMDWIQLEHSSQVLLAHSSDECVGPTCPLHIRTDHHMRSWPQNWREDTGVIERICIHGVGHPDPDTPEGRGTPVHGCDGCCAPPPPFDEDEFRERALSLLDQQI